MQHLAVGLEGRVPSADDGRTGNHTCVGEGHKQAADTLPIQVFPTPENLEDPTDSPEGSSEREYARGKQGMGMALFGAFDVLQTPDSPQPTREMV